MTSAAMRQGDGRAPTLRPYQVLAIAACRAELLHHRSTLLVQATGTGKTVEMAELARIEVSHGGRVLILVHRDELVRQTRRKLESIGLWPDVEKGSSRANTLAKVVIASVQTLRGQRLLRWARHHFTLVLVDECHHAVATGYRGVLNHFSDAKIVGVTATPDRADGQALGEVFETVAFVYDIRQAIAEGYLVPIVARRVVVDSIDLSEVKGATDFVQSQLAAVMSEERAVRGQVVPLLELARDRLTIGFCVDVAHAHAVAAMLNAYRPGCARAVSGETDDDEREQMLADHAAGRFQFLMNCDVLVEGYDCPEVSCVAMIRPTKSRGRFVQCAGRGLRPAPAAGKRDCLLLDLTGRPSKHKLIGPVDCLLGADVVLADDERDEIDRLLGTAQLDLEAVLDHAKGEVEKRREALQIAAVVRYRTENIDPFVGPEDAADVAPFDPGWRRDLASPGQVGALEKYGVTISKLPPSLSRADAWRLLSQLAARRRNGLVDYRRAKKIVETTRRFCTIDTSRMSAEDGARIYYALKEGGWHFAAIEKDPEVVAARQRSAEYRRGVA